MLSSVPRLDEEILRAAIQMNVDVGCGSQWEETVILDHLLLPAEFLFLFSFDEIFNTRRRVDVRMRFQDKTVSDVLSRSNRCTCHRLVHSFDWNCGFLISGYHDSGPVVNK